VLPDGLNVRIDLAQVPYAALFRWLAATGGVVEAEMLRTFNCGVGMILVVAPDRADAVADILRREGESVARLGAVIAAQPGTPRVDYHGNLPR
jgi:phosphoribosylformylglycinamidine cyclo-ligase